MYIQDDDHTDQRRPQTFPRLREARGREPKTIRDCFEMVQESSEVTPRATKMIDDLRKPEMAEYVYRKTHKDSGRFQDCPAEFSGASVLIRIALRIQSSRETAPFCDGERAVLALLITTTM